jgi:Fibronectin type-III domain
LSFLGAYKDALWLVNYPSLYVPALSGAIMVPRTVHSEVSGLSLWRLEVTAPVDLVVAAPASLLVPAGGNRTFHIAVDATAVPSGAVRHATLRLTRRGLQLTFPITIVRQ